MPDIQAEAEDVQGEGAGSDETEGRGEMSEENQREVYADMYSAINTLLNNGISVDTGARLVTFNESRRIPGIKLWGAIDYLKRFHNYGWTKARH